jgi:hypothetical protein
VNPSELAFTALLAVVLLGTAAYFGWRQLQTLRRLRTETGTPAEDRNYFRRQAIRRLVCCALMVLLAGLMIGWFFLHPHYQEVLRQLEARGAEAQPTDEQRGFLRFFACYCITLLLAVMVLIFLAAVDFSAIARYGMRHRRRLQADHRAELESQLARLRSQRNGNGEL